jgi:hypothetical protein
LQPTIWINGGQRFPVSLRCSTKLLADTLRHITLLLAVGRRDPAFGSQQMAEPLAVDVHFFNKFLARSVDAEAHPAVAHLLLQWFNATRRSGYFLPRKGVRVLRLKSFQLTKDDHVPLTVHNVLDLVVPGSEQRTSDPDGSIEGNYSLLARVERFDVLGVSPELESSQHDQHRAD